MIHWRLVNANRDHINKESFWPLACEFHRTNINVYPHFTSRLHTEISQVLKFYLIEDTKNLLIIHGTMAAGGSKIYGDHLVIVKHWY